MDERSALTRNYEYRRRLPHYQKAGRAIFVTFRKLNRDPFPANARDVILRHCVHDDGRRFQLHASVVMPDHAHLLLTPLPDEQGWPYALPAIMKLIKGVSARNVNRLLGASGPLWQEESFDHVLRNDESFLEKQEYIRQNPVRRPGNQPRRLQMAMDTRVERTLLSAGFGVGADFDFDFGFDFDLEFDLDHPKDQNQHQDQRQRTRVSAPHELYSATAATAFCALTGQQALPNATAYTAAIAPNPAARLIRDAIQPTVSPSATCRNVPKNKRYSAPVP